MTRIGFAYNQKPETTAAPVALVGAPTAESLGDEEPPSSAAAYASDIFAEWDSAETIDAVAAALAPLGDVIRLEADESFPERLRAERPDIVFNIAEGLHGANRESHVPAICEFFDVPYSGSDPFTLSLCLHKGRTKDVLRAHDVPTAPFMVVESLSDLESVWDLGVVSNLRSDVSVVPSPLASLHSPLFIKPIQEGSSKGITEKNLVRNREELLSQTRFLLETYAQPVIVEAFLPGIELTCGVLGNGATARVLPLVGMNFGALPSGALPIYGFEAKWVWDTKHEPLAIFECPARVDADLQHAIEDVVLRAYRVLGCRDWARVDVRLDVAGAPNIVEVNPLPGILPDPRDNSCLPKAARAAGLGYDELIQACLIHAAERQGVSLRRRTQIPTRWAAIA